jgi:hypothetical protein
MQAPPASPFFTSRRAHTHIAIQVSNARRASPAATADHRTTPPFAAQAHSRNDHPSHRPRIHNFNFRAARPQPAIQSPRRTHADPGARLLRYDHITSHHITSHHIMPPHITSSYLTLQLHDSSGARLDKARGCWAVLTTHPFTPRIYLPIKIRTRSPSQGSARISTTSARHRHTSPVFLAPQPRMPTGGPRPRHGSPTTNGTHTSANPIRYLHK